MSTTDVPPWSTTYELALPWTAPPLSLNHRRHWRATAAKVKQVRDATFLEAKLAKIKPCERVRVTLHYRPRDRRIRDSENPIPTLKACCDGLVDAGVVPDDDPLHMVKDMPVIHDPSSVSGLIPRLWLVVTPLLPAVKS